MAAITDSGYLVAGNLCQNGDFFFCQPCPWLILLHLSLHSLGCRRETEDVSLQLEWLLSHTLAIEYSSGMRLVLQLGDDFFFLQPTSTRFATFLRATVRRLH